MGIVTLLCFSLTPVSNNAMMAFLVGGILLIFGMGLFTLGSEMSMIPLGQAVGSEITRSRKVWVIVGISFLIGIIITVAEPDLQVLANQVPAIENNVIIWSVAVGVGILGSLAGAFVNYYLALWVGKPFLEKYGKYFFIKPEPLARACEVFNRYGAATTFVCRLVPVIRQLISIPAGISRMPLGSFTLFTGLGAGIWTAILAAVGYVLGRQAGDLSYLELCVRGKSLAAQNLPYVIGGAVVRVALYALVSKLVMGKRERV